MLSGREAIIVLKSMLGDSVPYGNMRGSAGHLLVCNGESDEQIRAAKDVQAQFRKMMYDGEYKTSQNYIVVAFEGLDTCIIFLVKCPESIDGPATGYTVVANRFKLKTEGLKWVGYVTSSLSTEENMEIGGMIVEKVERYLVSGSCSFIPYNGSSIADEGTESPSELFVGPSQERSILPPTSSQCWFEPHTPSTPCQPSSGDCGSEANGVRKAPD